MREYIDSNKFNIANFELDDGERALVRCPSCGKENYALNVLSGICTWCAYDINAKEQEE